MPTQDPAGIDVYVAGTGMVGYRQVTPEVDAALRDATTIFVVHPQDLVVEHFRSGYGADVVDLASEYEEGEVRSDAYRNMAERVLDAAEADAPVALAVYGHPTVFVSPASLIRERAPDRELAVEMLPGISSMDCIYTDFGIDPGETGIQMFEATDLLLREFDLNPEVPAMIWQVGSVETVLHSTTDSAPGRFTRLREHLQQYYPDDHEVSLLRAATYPITEPERLSFSLSEFESMHDLVDPAHTLFVPRVREPPVRNAELERQMTSREHLHSITRRGDDDT
jgi:uncharacterized protein YabN with tetrapyrrole methylase and pyrophosphatase domain